MSRNVWGQSTFAVCHARTARSPPLIPTFPTGGDGATSAALLASAFGLSPTQIDPVAVNILNLKKDLYGGQYLVPRPGRTVMA